MQHVKKLVPIKQKALGYGLSQLRSRISMIGFKNDNYFIKQNGYKYLLEVYCTQGDY